MSASALSFLKALSIGSSDPFFLFSHRKRLVSWNGRLCGRTGVGVRSGKAAGHDCPSRPLVSSIHALPLALSKTRTVTGATKPAQPKGGAGLASSHLQAGVI